MKIRNILYFMNQLYCTIQVDSVHIGNSASRPYINIHCADNLDSTVYILYSMSHMWPPPCCQTKRQFLGTWCYIICYSSIVILAIKSSFFPLCTLNAQVLLLVEREVGLDGLLERICVLCTMIAMLLDESLIFCD